VAEDPNTLMLFVRLALSLAMVLGLVGGITWLLRRRGLLRPAGVGASSGKLEILDRKALGKATSLVLARVGGQSLLLGVSGDRIEMLSDAPGLDAAWTTEPTPPTPFTETTHLTMGARRTGHPEAAPPAGRTRMNFIEALQELTVRRS
jgi:flagellar biosynthetic protein FliO